MPLLPRKGACLRARGNIYEMAASTPTGAARENVKRAPNEAKSKVIRLARLPVPH